MSSSDQLNESNETSWEIEIESYINNIKNGIIDSHRTKPLNNMQREKVHKMAETAGLITNSCTIPGIKEKMVVIKSPTDKISLVVSEFVITRNMVEFFVKFTSIPIPCTNPEYVDYYLEKLSKYYNTNLWKIFIDEIKIYGFNELKHNIAKSRSCIVDEIKSNPEYIQFCKTQLKIPTKLCTGNDIYQSHFTSKWFLSIDVKSANFTFLKHMCPSINVSWEEFIGKYTNLQFVIQSKPNREIIFGHLGNKQLLKGILCLVEIIDNIVTSTYSNFMKKVVCSTDEIIYEIDKSYNIEDFIESVKKIDPTESVYRIEKFNLTQLQPFNYFVKNIQTFSIIDGVKTACIKRQFKGVQKRHIMQCIKLIEFDTNITELDKKFTFEDEDVTCDNPLHFVSI